MTETFDRRPHDNADGIARRAPPAPGCLSGGMARYERRAAGIFGAVAISDFGWPRAAATSRFKPDRLGARPR